MVQVDYKGIVRTPSKRRRFSKGLATRLAAVTVDISTSVSLSFFHTSEFFIGWLRTERLVLSSIRGDEEGIVRTENVTAD